MVVGPLLTGEVRVGGKGIHRALMHVTYLVYSRYVLAAGWRQEDAISG